VTSIQSGRQLILRTAPGAVLGLMLTLTHGCSVQPIPLEPFEIGDRVVEDFEQLHAIKPDNLRPLTLAMAMEMALNHNLERRVKMVEEALAHGQLNVALQQLLPGLTGSVTRNQRTKGAGSTSETVGSGISTGEFTTSLEKVYTTGDATVVWNLLDFGVSYVRSRQQADDLLIAEERHRKVTLDILRDVRLAYWKAVSAEAMLPEVESSLQSARGALEKSRKLEQERLQPSDLAMSYQEDVLRQMQLLVELQKELVQAKTRLAALIHLRPGSHFILDVSGRDHLEIPEVRFPVGQLEELAMVSRSELREEDYRERIGALETRVALLKILPGFETTIGHQYDSNRYLEHSAWGEVAYRLSYSLNDLFAAPARIQTAQVQQQLAVARRLAMAMTVLTQVNLALQDFQQAKHDFALANDLYALKKRQMLRETAVKSVHGGASLALERRQVELLVAAIQRDRSYAMVQNAYGMILNSVGVEQFPAPDVVKGDTVYALAEYVHGRRLHGDIQKPPADLDWQQRLDQVVGLFGDPTKKFSISPVQSKTWKMDGDADGGYREVGKKTSRPLNSPSGFHSEAGMARLRPDESIHHGETKKWVLVNQ